MTDAAARNRATVERFFAGTHAPDLAGLAVIDETVTEGIRCHGFPGMNPVDRESYKDWFRFFRASFDNMSFETPAIVAGDDFVAVRWIVRVDHVGPFAGVAPTGRRVEFDGMALYRMQDGLIAETWLHANETALLAGIGALPAAA
jgi:predicted ester cyclase